MSWIDTPVALRAAGEAAVVVTVASTRGSAPRDAGTKMIVAAGAVHGTIGGGHLEHRAIAIARDMLRDDHDARLVRLGDGERACTALCEPLRDRDGTVVLFGAGHVGRALVRILAELPCRITWVDPRDDEFPRDIPANATVVCTEFERRLERRGMPAARFAAMTCPIGVPGIPGKEPAVIAAAVAAQLLQAFARANARSDVPAQTRLA